MSDWTNGMSNFESMFFGEGDYFKECIVISSVEDKKRSYSDIGQTELRDKETGKLCGCGWQNKDEDIIRVRICKKHFGAIMNEASKRKDETLLDRIQIAMDIVFEYGNEAGYR